LNTLFNCSKTLKLQDLGFSGKHASAAKKNGRFSSPRSGKKLAVSRARKAGKSAAMAAVEREAAMVEAGLATVMAAAVMAAAVMAAAARAAAEMGDGVGRREG
jgi:predicted phage tail protein